METTVEAQGLSAVNELNRLSGMNVDEMDVM